MAWPPAALAYQSNLVKSSANWNVCYLCGLIIKEEHMEIICPTAWCRPNHQEGSRRLTHRNSSTRVGIRAPKHCIKTNFRDFDGVGRRVI